MDLQLTVISWLALLPLVLAALRAVTLGDDLMRGTVTGRAGGETSAQTSLLMAGIVAVAVVVTALDGPGEGPGRALLLITLGAFVASHYLQQGFRDRRWQAFAGAAAQEAGFYWLTLAAAATALSADGASRDETYIVAAWTVVTVVTGALVVGTLARAFRRP